MGVEIEGQQVTMHFFHFSWKLLSGLLRQSLHSQEQSTEAGEGNHFLDESIIYLF